MVSSSTCPVHIPHILRIISAPCVFTPSYARYSTGGWHYGTYLKVLPPGDAPDGSSWTWEQCAAECNLSEGMARPCEFWTLQLGGQMQCLLMGDQGDYVDATGHYEGDRDPDCLQAPPPPPVACASIGSRNDCRAEGACDWQGNPKTGSCNDK